METDDMAEKNYLILSRHNNTTDIVIVNTNMYGFHLLGSLGRGTDVSGFRTMVYIRRRKNINDICFLYRELDSRPM